MADIKYDFAADVTAAERAIARLEQKVDKLENANKQLHRTSKRGAQQVTGDFQRWAAGLVSVGAGYAAVSRAVAVVIEGNRTLSREIDQLIKRLSEEELKLQIQGGLTPAQVEGQVGTIGQQLLKTPAVDLPQGILLQTQLISSGFKQVDVDSGAALQTMLQLQAATNQFGKALENPKETTKAISQLLKGMGIDNTAANIRRIGGDFAELFAGMDIQATDLTDLAGVASTMTAAGQSPAVQLAPFAAVTEVLGGAQAATTLKQLTALSIAAGGNPTAQEGLGTLGLRPDQIDLEGENIIDVLDLLGASMKRLNAEGRGVAGQQAIFDIYGTRAGANILSAISVAGRAREALTTVQGQGFEKAVDIFQHSRFAQNQQTLIQKQLLERNIGQGRTWQEIRDELDLLQAASAASDASAAQKALDLANIAQIRTNVAVSESIGLRPDRTDELIDAMRQQTHILEEIRDLAPKAPRRPAQPINREAQTEAPSGGFFSRIPVITGGF